MDRGKGGGRGRGHGRGGRGSRGGTIWRPAPPLRSIRRSAAGRFGAAHGAPVDPAQRADAAAVSRIAKKLRNRACERGERVRLLGLVDDVCSAHGVRSLRDLGLSVAAVDELRSLRQLEGSWRSKSAPSRAASSRGSALSHNLCARDGAAFEDLRLGPILKQPLVQRKFYADEALTAVPALEVADVVRELEKFRFKKRRVDLEEFLNWLAAKRGVASPRSLCLTMSKYAIGTTIKYASQAARDEKDSRVAALKQLRDARRDEWRAALGAKVEAGSSAARLGAQLSDAARLAVVEYGGLGATEPFGKVAGKIASAVVARRTPRRNSRSRPSSRRVTSSRSAKSTSRRRASPSPRRRTRGPRRRGEVREAARALDAEARRRARPARVAKRPASRRSETRRRAEACDGARVYPTLLELLGGRRPGTDARDAAAAAPAPPKRGRRSAAPPGVGAGRAGGHDAGGSRTARRAPDDASAASSEPERAARDDEPPGAVLASIRAGFGLGTDDARIDVSQSGQLQMLDNALKVIARDIYSSDSHFILELLQNADDNDYARAAPGDRLRPAGPSSRNNERGFARGTRALCHVGASSKGAGGSGYIGQKGIGFKSVFRVSSRPGVHSNGYAFALDEHMVAGAVPRPPSPELASWLAAAGLAAPPRGGTTIVLPLTGEFRGDAKRAELRERLAEVDPLLLLFLNRVRRIDVVDRGADGETTARSMRRADAPGGARTSVVTLADAVDGAEPAASTWLVVRREAAVVPWAPRATRRGRLDVARVLEALPVEREVVGFFRPVAAEIARRAFQDRLRPETRAALGVEALDASHALRLAAALADADDLEAPVFLEWAALLYRAAAPAGGVSAADRDRLRSLAVVPLAGARALGAAPIYLDRGEGAEPLEGFAAVRADLAVVDPAVLAPSLARPMVVSVLRSAGVKDATAEAVCLEHVLPALAAADAGEDRKRLNARWRFARAYFLTLRGSKRDRLLEALRGCAVPVSAGGPGAHFEPRARRGAAADIFLAHEHGAFDVLRETRRSPGASSGATPEPHAALGLRDSFGARRALVLETWAEEGPFEATVAHFENLYRLLYQELQRRGGAAAAIREFFASCKCTWVPDYRYEAEADDGKRAVVPGAFYALSDCVWADHSRVIDSCVHRGLSAAAPRVLQRHYGSLQGFCRRLCPACYGDGLGSRGADACPRCYDEGVSSGRPRALVPTAHDLAGHIAIAAALAELDVPHASACADVEAVLRVVSFAILAAASRAERRSSAPAPRQKVWPTSCGAFAAAEGDRILVIDDDEGLRETLFADAGAPPADRGRRARCGPRRATSPCSACPPAARPSGSRSA
ncbi:hypothetical protein JL721_9391 [Aureococcus anophagefferens]|nr:hypothetical protein JL721_9391 [Aureococcus anophagefferens]